MSWPGPGPTAKALAANVGQGVGSLRFTGYHAGTLEANLLDIRSVYVRWCMAQSLQNMFQTCANCGDRRSCDLIEVHFLKFMDEQNETVLQIYSYHMENLHMIKKIGGGASQSNVDLKCIQYPCWKLLYKSLKWNRHIKYTVFNQWNV